MLANENLKLALIYIYVYAHIYIKTLKIQQYICTITNGNKHICRGYSS